MARKIVNPLNGGTQPASDSGQTATVEAAAATAEPQTEVGTGFEMAAEVLPVETETDGNGKTVSIRYKRPRETFYQVQGVSKDGTCVDVLGQYATGHQARKALDAMRLAIARNYGAITVVQCRDRTDA